MWHWRLVKDEIFVGFSSKGLSKTPYLFKAHMMYLKCLPYFLYIEVGDRLGDCQISSRILKPLNL